MTEKSAHKQVYECVVCDDFELVKSYSGRAGTPGHEEYDRITPPQVCPVCGGGVQLTDEVVG